VVTNLEFDTALGLVRLGLVTGEKVLLRRAVAAARHLVDRDLDARSGLPFRHGPDHRVNPPEPGHAWLTGLLLVGCVTADDELIAAAGSIASGLARYPARGQGEDDRARDLGWPLLELETWLRFRPDDQACSRAADRLAQQLCGRWDARAQVLRFGEGERRRGAYLERAWLTGGILLPALRAHLARRPEPDLARIVARLEHRLATLVCQGRPGVPVRYWLADGALDTQIRLRGVPEAFLVLEGLPPPALDRALRRSGVRKALDGVLRENDPDLATTWSKVARCAWVLR
jgi:hypothetical protein